MNTMPEQPKPAYALIDEFRAAMRAAGLEPPDIIEPGTLHRFPGAGKGKDDKAAWCRLFDDLRGGVFGDFSSGLQAHWQADGGAEWSHEERAAFARKCAAEKKGRAEQEAKRREKAALKATGILAAAKGDPATHPYALAKGASEGISLGTLIKRGAWPQRGWDDALLIPVYSASGKIWTLGAINTDGAKDYLAGGAKQGNFHPFGKIRGAARVYVGEGVATVAVAHALDGSPAVAAMDAANLESVGKLVRCLAAPGADIIFLADDDLRDDPDATNTGIVAATQAAQAVGGRVAMPGLGRKTDFWDLWRERGMDAVQEAVDCAGAPSPAGDGAEAEMPDPPEWPDDDAEPLDIFSGRPNGNGVDGLLVDGRGQPLSCALNAMIWLSTLGLQFARNQFTQAYCVDGKEIDDGKTVEMLIEIQRRYRVNLRKEHLLDGLTELCAKNEFHPVADWLTGLVWDGKERVRRFLTVCLGAQDCDYTRAVSLSLFLSAVSRALTPGCKADTMIVLEGEQGTGKSSAIIELFSADWHTEVSTSLTDKDFYQNLRGKWAVEFGEMSGISKSESAHIKSTLTKRVDNYRASYARTNRDYLRQNIFIGTINEEFYLRDATGDRRYLPIKTNTIRLDWIRMEREQLWAEAVAMFRQELHWWHIPDAKEQQERRFQVDPWEEIVGDICKQRSFLTINELLVDTIRMPVKDIGQREQNRVSAILRRLGWTCKRERLNGLSVRVYRNRMA